MRLYIPALCLLLAACNNADTTQETTATSHESRYARLLDKYELKTDTLHVADKLDDGAFVIPGKKLDSTEVILLIGHKPDENTEWGDFYACYKYPIDTVVTGLISFVPDQESSIMRLYLYDKKKDTITSSFDLTFSYGDAGYFITKESWLFKDEKQQLRAFFKQREEDDRSVEDEKDSTVVKTYTYYLLGLKNGQADTLSKDSAGLSTRFAHWVKEPAKK